MKSTGPNGTPLYSYSPQSSPITKNAPNFDDGGNREKIGRLARHSSADYERIKVVGKGSFGMAVLYRRKDDDSFVILKEINLHELSHSEREMSLNEVRLLSRLDHPHIIAFYDSFEEDGILMIEMEYADGGTLAQFLARQPEALDESKVIDMFEQMTSAVSYLHDNNILHRDLKTANIFLTKELMVKVGDFGISKRMGTETIAQGAQTILGTPYYLSPEMCEGKTYNAKSDIWALGCCLYEMCSLKKAFDADNLPSLIHKIINSEYEPLSREWYAQEIRILVRDMLKTDPEQRPTAGRVLEQVRRFRSLNAQKGGNANSLSKSKRNILGANGLVEGIKHDTNSSSFSALYGFDVFNVTLSAVQEFPARVRIKQIAVSPTHQILLTLERRVYSWGENRFGQLGHGDKKKRVVPTQMEAMEGKGVSRVAAGKNFSLFCAGRGIVMAAGHRKLIGTGPIGEDQTKPKIVDALLTEDIIDICCGDEHAAVLTESGTIFVWGRGENGRLGTGGTKDEFVPIRIQIPTRQLINSIVCGPNSTILITNSGTVLGMGSNRHNKLNLNQRIGFFRDMKNAGPPIQQVEDVLVPTAVKPFPSRVVSASLGLNHSGVLLENGQVHLFGHNGNGELGMGNKQPMPNNCTRPVKALLEKACVHLICGDGFTMVGTLDNEIYFWGKKGGGEEKEKISMEKMLKEGDLDGRRPSRVFQMAKTREGWQLSYQERIQVEIWQPVLVLRLDICRKGSANLMGNSIQSTTSFPLIELTELVCSAKRVYCVVYVANEQKQKKCIEEPNDVSEMKRGKGRRQRRRSAPDALSMKSMDTWIKDELDNGEFIPFGSSQQSQQAISRGDSSLLLNSEQKLRKDIELLRGQLQEQKSTFHGHEKQMAQLQAKLAELQNLLRRQQGVMMGGIPLDISPPPEYPGEKPAVLRNTIVPLCPPEINQPSRACDIL